MSGFSPHKPCLVERRGKKKAKDLKQSPGGDYPWVKKVQRYIAYGHAG